MMNSVTPEGLVVKIHSIRYIELCRTLSLNVTLGIYTYQTPKLLFNDKRT